MKRTKKILAMLLCAVLLIGVSVGGTLAYLTSQDEVVNNFTVGKVKISLDEAPVNDAGKKLPGDRVQTNAYHLLPGHEYSKDPQVHITKGSEDCYVRMFVTITHDDEWNEICDAHKDGDNRNLFGAADMFTGLSPAWNLHEIHVDKAKENTRTYEFWYSSKVTGIPEDVDLDLAALFTGIKMPDELTNEDLAKLADNPETTGVDEGFKIYVVAQAIQADGFDTAIDAFTAAPAITGNDLIPGVVTTTP